MRILLDENLSAAIVDPLRDRGIDAVHTRSVDLATAPDEQIVEWCRREGRVAFTRDADFHSILARTGQSAPSVVRIRIEPLPEDELIRIIEWIVREKRSDLEAGVAMSVKAGSIRTHHLPIIAAEDLDV
jgi:predicted nuclease of predicted toxin-antitoxin system